MNKSPHIIWVCPRSRSFYRSKGEVRCRPGSVIPKLAEKGMRINVLIPFDASLLPKTRLTSSRIAKATIKLTQNYPVEFIKLTRGSVSPGIYMLKTPPLEPAIASAVFSKAALALAQVIKKPVDIFHLFDWESAMLPLFLELDKNGTKIFKNTRTFLNVGSLYDQGNFAPAVLSYLGVPETLFHPEGMEFFGQVSYLKSGLIFSDGIGLVEGPLPGRNHVLRNGTGLEGVLDAVVHKLRRWASERSLRSHVEAYQELLAMSEAKPVLPALLKRLETTVKDAQAFIESWGPEVPERYNRSRIAFLVQSPQKAYAFWEWSGNGYRDYGLFLDQVSGGRRFSLSRGLGSLGDFWIEVEPDQDYAVELVGWTANGKMETLLRSAVVRTPRNQPSANRNATFVDVKSRRKFAGTGESWASGRPDGGSSAWEWSPENGVSSLRENISSFRDR